MNLTWRTLAAGLAAFTFTVGPPARAGEILVSLSAGRAGADTPTETAKFQFDTSSADLVAITKLAVGNTATAATGGGSVFFGGAGTPVLLDLAGGGARLTSPNAPAGLAADLLTSVAPQAGATVPSAAALLGVSLADPTTNGNQVLTVSATSASGGTLGTTEV